MGSVFEMAPPNNPGGPWKERVSSSSFWEFRRRRNFSQCGLLPAHPSSTGSLPAGAPIGVGSFSCHLRQMAVEVAGAKLILCAYFGKPAAMRLFPSRRGSRGRRGRRFTGQPWQGGANDPWSNLPACPRQLMGKETHGRRQLSLHLTGRMELCPLAHCSSTSKWQPVWNLTTGGGSFGRRHGIPADPACSDAAPPGARKSLYNFSGGIDGVVRSPGL